MISNSIIVAVDESLDRTMSTDYLREPLALDWLRAMKIVEEMGEVVTELISYTGGNPRKERKSIAKAQMLSELGDVSLSAIYGIQHFTKDIEQTREIIIQTQIKHESRLR